MRILAVDIGSSSVKAAILTSPDAPRRQARVAFKTRYDGERAEVEFGALVRALKTAIAELGHSARRVDLIVLTGMAPSWLAIDGRGRALTPVVTHQDRRSVQIAHEIEKRVGRARHMALTGNRPIPGGISSTTAAWFVTHAPAVMKKAALVGHLNTALLFGWCGTRVIDPSNAGFTGLYRTRDLGGWSDTLCQAAGIDRAWLPDVRQANAVAGHVTRSAATAWGLREGTPVLAGIMDGSCAMLLAGAKAGRLVNVIGSTDVLAVCNDHFRPHAELLTRPLGVGRAWLNVGTLAAAGSALEWLRFTCFGDLSPDRFHQHLAALRPADQGVSLSFDALLAGSRTAIEPSSARLIGLTLSTTRDDIAAALLADLARRSAARLPLLASRGVRLKREVVTTGGGTTLAPLLHAGWPKRHRFRDEKEATLRGLWVLAESARE